MPPSVAPSGAPTRLAVAQRIESLHGVAGLQAWLERHLARARRHALPFALLAVRAEAPPLDDPALRDRLLDECARRLGAGVRAGDCVLRYQDAAFAVVLPGAGHAAAQAVAHRLSRTVGGRYRIGEALLVLHLHVGDAAFSASSPTAAALLRAADVAS